MNQIKRGRSSMSFAKTFPCGLAGKTRLTRGQVHFSQDPSSLLLTSLESLSCPMCPNLLCHFIDSDSKAFVNKIFPAHSDLLRTNRFPLTKPDKITSSLIIIKTSVPLKVTTKLHSVSLRMLIKLCTISGAYKTLSSTKERPSPQSTLQVPIPRTSTS